MFTCKPASIVDTSKIYMQNSHYCGYEKFTCKCATIVGTDKMLLGTGPKVFLYKKKSSYYRYEQKVYMQKEIVFSNRI